MRPSPRRRSLSLECLEGRTTPAVSLLSVNAAGTDTGNGGSIVGTDFAIDNQLSSDGRFVLVRSQASNLTTAPDVGPLDLYVRDTVQNSTTLVSTTLSGKAGGAGDDQVASLITPDGRFVVFAAGTAEGPDGFVAAGTFADPGSTGTQLYRRDLQTKTTQLVSIRPDGKGSLGGVTQFDVSDDGRLVVFSYSNSDLVANDTNNAADVFVRDMTAGTTTLVSHTAAGGVGKGESVFPIISGSGATIIFQSTAPDLTTVSDTNSTFDLFAYSVSTKQNQLVTANAAGTAAVGGFSTSGSNPDIDASGTRILFDSDATTIATGSTTGSSELYLRDLTAKTTTLVSRVPGNGLAADGGVRAGRISRDGSTVAFVSVDPFTGTATTSPALYLFNTATSKFTAASHNPAGALSPVAGNFSLSADGKRVAFSSGATDLVAGAKVSGTGTAVYVYDRTTDKTLAVSTDKAGAVVGSSPTTDPVYISANGLKVAFTSNQSLGFTDTNGKSDVFVNDFGSSTTPAITTAIFVVGQPDGSVRFANGTTVVPNFRPLDAGTAPYKGLVQVAVGDLNGDKTPDLYVAASDPAGGNNLDTSKAGLVFVYDGTTLASGTPTLIHTYRPFTNTDGPDGTTGAYVNGLNIAVADANGDGTLDLIAGTRGGTATAGNREYGRIVVVNNGTDADGSDDSFLSDVVKPFGNGYEKGVIVAGGDINGDKSAELAVTRGGPVAATNTNKTVKVKVYRLNNGPLTELNLSGGATVTPFAPFAAVTNSSKAVIERDARVAFVDPDGDGKSVLVFSAADPVTDPTNVRVRIGVYSINATSGAASLISTGSGTTPATYLVGSQVTNHAIAHADQDRNGSTDLALLIAMPGSPGLQFLDPLTGVVKGTAGASVFAAGNPLDAL